MIADGAEVRPGEALADLPAGRDAGLIFIGIASSVVRLMALEGSCLVVRGLDCVSGTPLLDIKPHDLKAG